MRVFIGLLAVLGFGIAFIAGCSDASPPRDQRSVALAHAATPSTPAPRPPASNKRKLLGGSAVTLPTAATAPAAPRFVDRHAELGLEFQFDNGARGLAFMIESTGGGGGWCDFDGDGWSDLILVQGGDPLAKVPHVQGDRILRNLGGKSFQDVTDSARPLDLHHGQGLAVGDFNDDGFPDLFISNVDADVLWVNQGDGTFADVTSAAGLADPRWGSSAAWADLDGDHDLDLFVCNYLDYDVHHPIACRKADGSPAICHPESLPAGRSECYENLGDGAFRAVTDEWGLRAPGNKALGLVIADFDGDRRIDVYVANDVMPNHLFIRQPEGGFREQAVELGCAANLLGHNQASMGIACNDYDENGFLDLYCTHFTNDSNTLYANLGAAGFRDVTRVEGLHEPTLRYLAFGTVMEDFNADGRMDVIVANGHIDDWREKGELWKMPPQLFSYQGGRWFEQRDRAGDYFQRELIGRAISMADFDHDHDPDLLIVHQGDPAALLDNQSQRGHWLEVALCGHVSNRRAVGARVTVRQGTRERVRQRIGGSSYIAAHDDLLRFGLGAVEAPCEVLVEWPSGAHSEPLIVPVDSSIVLFEDGRRSPRIDTARSQP